MALELISNGVGTETQTGAPPFKQVASPEREKAHIART